MPKGQPSHRTASEFFLCRWELDPGFRALTLPSSPCPPLPRPRDAGEKGSDSGSHDRVPDPVNSQLHLKNKAWLERELWAVPLPMRARRRTQGSGLHVQPPLLSKWTFQFPRSPPRTLRLARWPPQLPAVPTTVKPSLGQRLKDIKLPMIWDSWWWALGATWNPASVGR